ncbi:MAG: DUF4834 family protein [Alistipes sp.]|nr:DUF4834 family protein [Alistipes sp.]MBR2331558.1 DUF4834 family protein [Alistipes sp.]
MNIISIILDSILSYIRRNPLTVTIIVMIAVFAPSLFGAALIGLLIGALILLIGPLFMLWRLMRQAERGGKSSSGRGFRGFYTNFDGNPHNSQQSYNRGGTYQREQGFGSAHSGSAYSGSAHSGSSQRNPNEGQVRVFTTSEQPQKRVSDNVGDYVEFEEVKSNK